MHETGEKRTVAVEEERSHSWWFRIYAFVVFSTILVILGLGFFSRYFSS